MPKTNKKPTKKTVTTRSKRAPQKAAKSSHVVTRVRKHVRRRTKMAVVPHKENDYRPQLLRWYGLLLIILVIAAMFGINYMRTGSVLGTEANIAAVDLLKDTNGERVSQKLPTLSLNDALSKAAYMKAQDMLKQQYWAHEAPDGTTPWAWFARVGYNYAYAGENLAKNFPTADSTVAAWMASSSHRANILNSHYTDVGFAVVDGLLDGKNTTLVVAMYGQPMAKATAVLGGEVEPKMDASKLGGLSPMTKFGVAMQTMTPAALSSVMLLMFLAVTALATHTYRKQLPRAVRESWRYHAGAYKAAGLTSMAVAIVMLYSGGQI